MDTFQALSDPTRRTIIEMLARHGKMPASEISQRFPVTKPAISQHLKVLREAKLVDMEKKAQQRLYSINTQPMHEVEDWLHELTQKWEDQFKRLDTLLAEEKKEASKTTKNPQIKIKHREFTKESR